MDVNAFNRQVSSAAAQQPAYFGSNLQHFDQNLGSPVSSSASEILVSPRPFRGPPPKIMYSGKARTLEESLRTTALPNVGIGQAAGDATNNEPADQSNVPEDRNVVRIPKLAAFWKPSKAIAKRAKRESGNNRSVRYTAFWRTEQRLADPQCQCYIPEEPVVVKSVDMVTEDILGHKLKTCEFKITLIHGDFEWTVRRTYEEWRTLHTEMREFEKQLLKGERMKRLVSKESLTSLPKVNIDAEEFTTAVFLPTSGNPFAMSEAPAIMAALGKYLDELLQNENAASHIAMRMFLEISPYSFLEFVGRKFKEGFVLWLDPSAKTRRGLQQQCRMFCSSLVSDGRWSEMWLVVKESFLMLVDPNSCQPREVLLLCQETEIYSEKKETKMEQGLRIKNPSKELMIRCGTVKQMQEFMMDITKAINVYAKSYTSPQPHKSFAPFRKGCRAKWLVDGKAYFREVAEKIQNSTDEILIASWWLVPNLHLVRPVENNDFRLDYLLADAADRGVNIFILLYWENGINDHLNSREVASRLASINPDRIKVTRHPNQSDEDAKIFWTNAEKILVIDRTFAFCGGLDLCLGQWDSPDHDLVGFRHKGVTFTIKDSLQFAATAWDGKINSQLSFQNLPHVLPKLSGSSSPSTTKLTLEAKRSIDAWFSKDFDSDRTQAVSKSVFNTYEPRLPWHDVAVVVEGPGVADLVRHFVQRWNHSQGTNEGLLLIPMASQFSSQEHVSEAMYPCTIQVLRSLGSWSGGEVAEASIQHAMVKTILEAKHYIYIESELFITSGKCDGTVTNRIGQAIVDRILRAHRNGDQFRVFIVMPLMPAFEGRIGERSGSVLETVLHWVQSSISRGPESIIEQLVRNMDIHFIPSYITINSLRTWDVLEGSCKTQMVYCHSKVMIVDDHTAIIGSANISDRSLLGTRNSEIALLIRDEETVTSCLNGREVEAGKFALTLRWRLMMEHLGLMYDDVSHTKELLRDPVNEHFWKDIWRAVARKNTDIFEQTFNCVPSDDIRDFNEYHYWEQRPKLADTDPERAHRLLRKVRGNLVVYPMGFLRNEKLKAAILADDGLVDPKLWT